MRRATSSPIYWGAELEVECVFSAFFRAFPNCGRLDAEYDRFETDIDPTDGVVRIEDASFLTPRNVPESSIGCYANRWSVTAFGRNRTDETYETFLPIAKLFAAGIVNRPRSDGLELQFDF